MSVASAPQDAPRRGRPIGALVVVLGLLAAAAQVALGWLRDDLVERELAHLRAIADAKAALAESHLWMEEFVSGEQLSHEQLNAGLVAAAQQVAAMLGGGAESPPARRVRPVTDTGLRDAIERFAGGIAGFTAMAQRREADYRSGAAVGVGTLADVAYDAAFAALSVEADGLRVRIERRVDATLRRTRELARALLVAWGVAVVLALFGLWRLERTRAATEQALRDRDAQAAQAQKLEAVGRLAAGLAHDINNYLAAIVAQSELVLRKPAAADDPDGAARVQRRVSDVVVTANRAAGLIRRLLSFSRPESVPPGPLRIDEALHEVEPVLRQLIGDANRLELVVPAAPLVALVDPIELEQLLINLAVNARAAMPDGGRLRIAAAAVALSLADTLHLRIARAPGDYVCITVEDDGRGIAPAVLPLIFEPYYTSKAASGNVGLGLATVYGILLRSGGSIGVDSALGVGTRFRVYLPMPAVGE